MVVVLWDLFIPHSHTLKQRVLYHALVCPECRSSTNNSIVSRLQLKKYVQPGYSRTVLNVLAMFKVVRGSIFIARYNLSV